MRTARTIAQGDLGFIEGPVFASDGTLYVTSITKGGIYRVDPDSGETVLFADTDGGGNGATADDRGGMYVAQNGGRRMWDGPVFAPAVCGVQHVAADGAISWISQDPVTPNDLRFGPDGLLYVTDPTRSLAMDDGRLWRVDPSSGASELLTSVPWFPNGLAFGPDDRLYVGDTRDGVIYVSTIADGVLSPLEPAIRMKKGHPDGLAFDADGHLVACAVDLDGQVGTVQTWTVEGEQVDEFSPGRGSFPTNLAFDPSGAPRLVLTLADLEEVLVVDDWGVGGLAPYPFRDAAGRAAA
jgi:gluconolactonase